MTLCSECHRDRGFGRMVGDDWVCGGCNPVASVAQHVNRGNGRRWR